MSSSRQGLSVSSPQKQIATDVAARSIGAWNASARPDRSSRRAGARFSDANFGALFESRRKCKGSLQ